MFHSLSLPWLFRRLDQMVTSGIPHAMDAGALLMKQNILRAFAVGGPGWKPLKQITIQRKIQSGAPDPNAILREFNVMRDSIDIKDESVVKVKFGGSGSNVLYDTTYKRSVGLFSDTAKHYDKDKEIGFRGPLDVVKRGTKHEFGGWELQHLKNNVLGRKKIMSNVMTEVVTKGLEKKNIKGESVVANQDKLNKKMAQLERGVSQKSGKTKIDKVREVKQKTTKKKVLQTGKKGQKFKLTQLIYIPERSFLRMPFDISEGSVLNRIRDVLRRVLDLTW